MNLPKSVIILIAVFAIWSVGQYFFLSSQFEGALRTSLTGATQDTNTTVTKIFVNEVYPHLSTYLDLVELSELDSTIAESDMQVVDKTVRNFILGTDVLKVKIYNKAGVTLYSTDETQIGEDKSSSMPFLAAVRGMPGSQITHRGKFDASEGEVFNRDLVSSYIPIRGSNNAIIGVAELYTDRTPAIERVEKLMTELSALIVMAIGVMVLLLAASIWALYQHAVTVFEEAVHTTDLK